MTNAEQGAGLSLLWGPIGKALASLPQADVIADCGRLGADGPLYDLLAEATTVVLVTKVHVADVIRLRDRATAFAAAAQSRGRRGFGVGVVVVADHKKFRASLGEVQHVLGQANAPATVLGGIAHDTKGADLLSGEWGGNLDRTMLIKTAREVARQLVQGLPPIGNPAARALPPSRSPRPSRAPARAARRPARHRPAATGRVPTIDRPASRLAIGQPAARGGPSPGRARPVPASPAPSARAPPHSPAAPARRTWPRHPPGPHRLRRAPRTTFSRFPAARPASGRAGPGANAATRRTRLQPPCPARPTAGTARNPGPPRIVFSRPPMTPQPRTRRPRTPAEAGRHRGRTTPRPAGSAGSMGSRRPAGGDARWTTDSSSACAAT